MPDNTPQATDRATNKDHSTPDDAQYESPRWLRNKLQRTAGTPRNWNEYAVWEKNHAIMICHAVDGDNCIRGFDTVEEAELALKALQSPGVTEATAEPRTLRMWSCKIGAEVGDIPSDADQPMRQAVTAAFRALTGSEDAFCFSGWGDTLNEMEIEIVAKDLSPQAVAAARAALLARCGSEREPDAMWPDGSPLIHVECPECSAGLDLKRDHAGQWRVRIVGAAPVPEAAAPTPLRWNWLDGYDPGDGETIGSGDMTPNPTEATDDPEPLRCTVCRRVHSPHCFGCGCADSFGGCAEPATAEPRGLVFPLQCSARRLARLAEDSPDRDDRDQLYEYSAVCDDAAALLARCGSERELDAQYSGVAQDIRDTAAKLMARVGAREDDDARFMVRMAVACDRHAADLGYYGPQHRRDRTRAPVAQPEPREPDAWPEHACRFCGGTIHPDVLVHWQGDARVQAGNVHQMCYERYNSAPIASPPTMTDLMVTPESLSGYDGASPVPEAAAAWVRGCKCDSPWDTGAGQPYRCLKCGAWWITPAPDAEWTEMRDAANEYTQNLGRFGDRPSYAGRLSEMMEAADAYVSHLRARVAEWHERNRQLRAMVDSRGTEIEQLRAKVAELERAPVEPDLGGFVIWSGEHGAWWRTHRSGYTQHLLAAGVYTNEEAVAATRHCGPEKRIEIQPLSEQYGLVSLDGTVAARLLERATVAPDTRPACFWTHVTDGVWDTTCDNTFALNDGAPNEQGMVYCCYCGGNLRAVTDTAEAGDV